MDLKIEKVLEIKTAYSLANQCQPGYTVCFIFTSIRSTALPFFFLIFHTAGLLDRCREVTFLAMYYGSGKHHLRRCESLSCRMDGIPSGKSSSSLIIPQIPRKFADWHVLRSCGQWPHAWRLPWYHVLHRRHQGVPSRWSLVRHACLVYTISASMNFPTGGAGRRLQPHIGDLLLSPEGGFGRSACPCPDTTSVPPICVGFCRWAPEFHGIHALGDE